MTNQPERLSAHRVPRLLFAGLACAGLGLFQVGCTTAPWTRRSQPEITPAVSSSLSSSASSAVTSMRFSDADVQATALTVSPVPAVQTAAPEYPAGQAQVAQVAYVEAQAASATCGPGGPCLGVPPIAGGSGDAGCIACQTQPAVAQGNACYPNVYFNPYLLDPNEFICDGGDNAPAARARVGDQIIGVELEDTVVRYTTERDGTHVQASNRVCLYAPRFAAVRRVTGAESGDLAISAIGVNQPEGPYNAQLNQPGLAVTGRDQLRRGEAVRGPDAMRDRNRGVPVERVLQPEMYEDVLQILANLSLVNRGILRDNEKPWLSMAAASAVVWSIDEHVAVTVNELAPVTLTRDLRAEEMVVYDFPDAGRLRICKLADKSDALPGEIVTFILRVDNIGDSTVNNVIITDSLVTRLEYVTDSQKSPVGAAFSTTENEGESLRLTWKLEKPLKVGEGATIEFKCKVR